MKNLGRKTRWMRKGNLSDKYKGFIEACRLVGMSDAQITEKIRAMQKEQEAKKP